MSSTYRTRLDALNVPAEPPFTWNERYRAALKGVGLRIEQPREGHGPYPQYVIRAPKCVEGKAYGWPAESLIVEARRG